VPLDLSRYEDVDWDPEEQEDGNWQHCARAEHLGPRPDRVVDEVLRCEPVELKMRVEHAEFSLVGPDVSTSSLWVVLFDTSHKRGDWLRPVTGWAAPPTARDAWHRGRSGGTVRTWLTG
jgi:hypothetical protein